MTIITASSLTAFQACPRRWLLERAWQVARWRPKSLADKLLREAVWELSAGRAATSIVPAAKAQYLERAANPGLDLPEGADPYQVAVDWCALLSTVLTAIARAPLLTMRKCSPQQIFPESQDVTWQPLAWQDDSGQLHRWVTVEKWDADAIARELHSWHVAGDMAVMDAPMQLHVVEVGRIRDGRRRSPWCQAWRHPMYITGGQFRFQRARTDRPGKYKRLQGDWVPTWLADMPQVDPDMWVDVLTSDGVMPDLLQHPTIGELSPETQRSTLTQIRQLADRMRYRLDRPEGPVRPFDEPMARGQCDGWVPCPWQQACYVDPPPQEKQLGKMGLYVPRPAPVASVHSHPRAGDATIPARDEVATLSASISDQFGP